ncbi:UbiX family flavin prenyltransferase [Candidatus Magnetomonas plexicatena]|uniref:UbiX family flavin prenyltransferase n=1 Tax=Candidatus Magnetomonas plexicatena TaxID=2552947 RepID=UPI001C761E9B|nr:UbiX family flavin prenyltransferase [Nitrospirales bacterium LBB_01]
MGRKKYIVAITGASGSVLALRFIGELLKTSEVHLIISTSAFSVIKDETGNDWNTAALSTLREYFKSEHLFYSKEGDLYCPLLSGTFLNDGMIVIPCSMKTLSGIANGYGENIVQRAADVTLKERRRLILVPREMPFSAIHLENMLKLSRIGVTIAPPVMAFYTKPKSIDDMLNFITGKLLDNLSISHNLFKRWGN